MNLYTVDGWINIEEISKLDCWLYVIVGPRQVGKTYGILKHFVKNNIHGIYLRRTADELDLISSNEDLNPFLPLAKEGYNVDILKAGKNVYQWGDVDIENDRRQIINNRGLGLSLGTIAKMRGFSGGSFTDIFLDEFIPEKTVIKRKNEGDAVLNAYTTINGNRELFGKPPLKMWLAANAFDINNDILQTLGLSAEIEKMQRRGQEWKIIRGGVFLAYPKSDRIIKKRSETALMSYLRKNKAGGKFMSTALENKFAYDNLDLIRPKSIKGYHFLARIGGVYIWENDSSLYCCKSKYWGGLQYEDTPEDKVRCQLELPEIRMLYNTGYVTFSDVETLLTFRKYFDIKS